MIAYKCDRCGGYFDHKGKILISERVEDPHYSSTNDYRLCPSCEKVLLSWLHNESSEELCTVYADNEPLYSCSKETMEEILNKRRTK